MSTMTLILRYEALETQRCSYHTWSSSYTVYTRGFTVDRLEPTQALVPIRSV